MTHIMVSYSKSIRHMLWFWNKLQSQSSFSTSVSLGCKKILDDTDPETTKIKKELTDLPEKQFYDAHNQEGYGWVYDKRPFKYTCKAGKAYVWCACGRSHKQPFCDGTHKNQHLRITLRPIRWDCTETKEYWFCNCKQTRHRPFCDGTHKLESVQNADSTIKDSQSKVTTTTADAKKLIKSIRDQKPLDQS